MYKDTSKGVPISVNAVGLILINPTRLAEALDSGINPLARTEEDCLNDVSVDAEDLIRYPHSFARAMSDIRKT